MEVRAVTYGTGDVPGAYTRGNGIKGTSKLVVDATRGVIVGATFTGPDVQELLHSATIAIVAEVPLERLWHAVPSFPTVSEVWLRLLEAYGHLGLRAADAMQLGAALVSCEGRPRRHAFVTLDDDLARAAGTEGFDVISPGR